MVLIQTVIEFCIMVFYMNLKYLVFLQYTIIIVRTRKYISSVCDGKILVRQRSWFDCLSTNIDEMMNNFVIVCAIK